MDYSHRSNQKPGAQADLPGVTGLAGEMAQHNITLSRRGFLAATAGCALSAGLAMGMPRRDAKVVNIGLIGMGIQNRYHLDWFMKSDRSRVVAVCDVDTVRREDAKSRADKHYKDSSCAAYVDHRELLKHKELDAVVIGTPDHWHAHQIIDSCRAGKDIYCEKPLTLTLHESKRCMDEVRQHNVILQTGSQQRTEYDGRFRTAVDYVRNGRIGKVTAIYCGIGVSSTWCDLSEEPLEPGLDWDRWLGPAPMRPYNSVLSPRGVNTHYPMWRLYREYSGGLLTDWGAHHFDIAQWMLNEDNNGPVDIIPPIDPNDKTGVVLRYQKGVMVVHGGPSGITVIGDKGTLFIDRDKLFTTPDSILKEPLKESDTRLPVINDHRGNWLDCIHSRQRPVCDVEVGARSIALAQLSNLAYWNRKPLTWNPLSWEFVGKNAAEANGWRDYVRRAGYELPT